MFSRPPRPADVASDGAYPERRERSRTPASQSAEPWTTGNRICDEWLLDYGAEADVLDNFSSIGQLERKKIALKAMDVKPTNLNAWLNKCISNHRMNELERRLTQAATPQTGRDRKYREPAAPRATSPERSGRGSPPSSSRTQIMPSVQAEAPIADVCLQLAKSWPNWKSAMMATMMEVLDDEAVQAVMDFDLWMQNAIAFAFMVTAPEEKAGWSTFVRQLVD